MRLVIFILVVSISFINNGFVHAQSIYKFYLQVRPESILVEKDAIWLKTKKLGLIPLNNLQINEKGPYTKCKIVLTNEDFANQMFYEREKNPNLQRLIKESLLKKNIDLEQLVTMGGKVYFKGKINDDGSKSVEAGANDENEDKNYNWGIRARTTQDPDGNVSTEVEIEGSIDF